MQARAVISQVKSQGGRWGYRRRKARGWPARCGRAQEVCRALEVCLLSAGSGGESGGGDGGGGEIGGGGDGGERCGGDGGGEGGGGEGGGGCGGSETVSGTCVVRQGASRRP